MKILSVTSKRKTNCLVTIFFCSMILFACNQNKSTATVEKQDLKNSSTTKAIDTTKTKTSTIPSLGELPDNGKPFFKVAVYKNNEPFAQYEGDWAIALQSGKLLSIQFPASKRMLKISHGMIMYFNSPSEGSFQIVPSGNEKEKPVIIFTPEIDGAYGIAVSAASGTVNLSKFLNEQISGNIDAVGKDEKGNSIIIKASFINVKNNISN
jgi:hypothetical protein